MYRTLEEFNYLLCAHCGCLQIETIPSDLNQHYPGSYYSAKEPVRQPLVNMLQRTRARQALGHRSVMGRLLVTCFGVPDFVTWLQNAGVDTEARVLDVGAGNGERLTQLESVGLRHLIGIDPILDAPITRGNVDLRPGTLEDVTEQFDLITFHHSFEHIVDQSATLARAASMLRPSGCILIRIPVFGKYAWRTYGEHWVQLDAPRHLYLHSEASMELLAGQAGLRIDRIDFDSNALQFWGSERYASGLPLTPDGPGRRFTSVTSRLGTQRTLRERARRLNAARDGDQAAFYLRR